MITSTIVEIPDELQGLHQWVGFQVVEVQGKPKPTKIPINPHTGAKASTTNPATWGSFVEALEAVERFHLDGVGFVFTELDEYVGVDIDGCRNPQNGALDPVAREIIERLDSYTEASVTGTGVHVICRGQLPPGQRRRGQLEMYSEGRYFVMTGEHLDWAPAEINERTNQLAAIHAEFLHVEDCENGTGPPRGHQPTIDDDRLLERAFAARNGPKVRALYDGDLSGHGGDHSAADMALCAALAFWTSDPGQIDRLFCSSSLFREKWTERRGEQTYGERTIDAVLKRPGETYTPPRPHVNGTHDAVEEPLRDDGEAQVDETGEPEVDTEEPDADDGPDHLTDWGNARRLVRRHGKDIRYCTAWGRWLEWNGQRFRHDDTNRILRLAKATVKDIYTEAKRMGDDEGRRGTVKHALASEAQHKLEAMVTSAQSEPGISVRVEDLDANPWLVNVENGTIDLRTGQLRPHDRNDLITMLAPVKFDATATAPTFIAFIQKIMGDRQALITYLQRTLGRTLTGDITEQRMEMWYGVGSNGKSTLINAVLDLLGNYGKMAAPGLLLSRKHERHPTEVADLKGARLVASVEIGDNRRLAEELVKQLTGGERLKARLMRQDFWEFTPTHKLFVACNHKPTIAGADHAIWRRVRLVPFNVIISDREQDKQLSVKLAAERPGILNWLIQGCLDWQKYGLSEPEEVSTATNDYRASQDVIAAFIADCCTTGPNDKATAGALYAAYAAWCTEGHEHQDPKRTFGRALTERGFKQSRTGDKRWWGGIGLVTQQTLNSDTE